MPKIRSFITNLDHLESHLKGYSQSEEPGTQSPDHSVTVHKLNLVQTNLNCGCKENDCQKSHKRHKKKHETLSWGSVLKSNSSNKKMLQPPKKQVAFKENKTVVTISAIPLPHSNIPIEKTISCPGRTCHCSCKKEQRPQALQPSTANLPIRQSLSTNPCPCRKMQSCDGVERQFYGEIEKVRQYISQCEIEAQNITTVLKHSYNDLMENKEKHFEQIAGLRQENADLKLQLNHYRNQEANADQGFQKVQRNIESLEGRVDELHLQTEESRRCLNERTEKRNTSIKDKIIKKLAKRNVQLENAIVEKTKLYEDVSCECNQLQVQIATVEEKFRNLSNSNNNLCNCVTNWRDALRDSIVNTERCKNYIKELEDKIKIPAHSAESVENLRKHCGKLTEKYEKREQQLNEKIIELITKIANLEGTSSEKVTQYENELQQLRTDYNNMKSRYAEIHNVLQEYEECASKCKLIENECKLKCETALNNEENFKKERKELHKLVEELANVVKHNKNTLLQLSEVNKIQESLLQTQNTELLSKGEEFQQAVSEIDTYRHQNQELQQEIEDLKESVNQKKSCHNEICNTLNDEIEHLRKALNVEKDNHLIKEKIIKDQSLTICNLQCEIKEKTSKLHSAKEDVFTAENEVLKINEELIFKHQQLEREQATRNNLLKNMKKLEMENNDLTYEMQTLEELLASYNENPEKNETLQQELQLLQQQIEYQKTDWNKQKQILDREKENAMNAAKFATNKLLDTVADFQTHVDAQRKVQKMLTHMLHNKSSQLDTAKAKISSISQLSKSACEELLGTQELFRADGFNSAQNMSSSVYSSCTSCSRTFIPKKSNTDLSQILGLLGEPICQCQATK